MSVKSRSGGIPLRGGGGGGGKIAVYNQAGGEETELSLAVTSLVWATQDGLGFAASVDPEDETRIIIGNPPVFLDPIVWSHAQPIDVRVSESDLAEADTYLTNGFETQVVKGSESNFIYNSTVGRGFGAESNVSVKTYHNGVLVDDVFFVCSANGTQTLGNVSVNVSSYAEDGDGSAFQGKLRVTVDGDGVIGSTKSGMCRVEISFLEQKWEERVNISQNVFRDKNPNTPSIDTPSTVRDHDDTVNHVLKYISGIGYFDMGSMWQLDSTNISNLNEDSSHPTANITVDAEEFGITTFTSSPWGGDVAEWLNVTNLDTVQGIDYVTERAIDKSSFRHIGTAVVDNTIRDSWGDAPIDTSNSLKVCIDTFSQPSTDTVEYFTEENMRLDSDYTTAWDSEQYCADGEAIVFGGSLYHGADLPRILENVAGGLGSCGSLSATLPDRKVDGSSRQNPNYTGHTRPAVFFREFLTPNASSYPSINMNIVTNGDLGTQLASGDLKIYIWKLNSIDTTTPNIVKPADYNPTNGGTSLAGSVWGHASYNFAAYDDGAAQTAATSGCLVTQTGNMLNLSTGGFSVVDGILVRFEVSKGVRLDEVSVTFSN
ncbi:conserved hypothetical protein [Vibrio phage 501E54-1]|nr:conserved hypothetical protein [Vibrio phage 501E54-1]